jgi:hypothetical protein
VTELGATPRRSTRIPGSVRLSVSGQTEVGNPFSEVTLTLAVNCHGCMYPSRNEHRPGSWVTLDFPHLQREAKTQPVRAQVKYVRPPRSPRDHYQVGVELEAPANVWHIEPTPKDWLQYPAEVSSTETIRVTTPTNGSGIFEASTTPAVTTDLAPQASALQAGSARPDRASSLPDQLLRVLEKNLQQAAEKAVAAAVTSQLKTAVSQSITAIDKFSQASVRQVEEHCALYRDKLIGSAREDLLRSLQADITQAQERLQKQLQDSLSEVQEKTQDVTKNASSEAHVLLAESVDFLKETARGFHVQFATQLGETTDRAAAELSAETVRFSDRQLTLLTKQAQAAIGEGSALLETRATEVRSQLDTAATTMLGSFQEKAALEIEQAATGVRQNFTASLTSLADEMRATLETRQRAWQEEMTRTSEQQAEQFRQRLSAILHSSIVAAISSVNEHSKTVLNALSEQMNEPAIVSDQSQASS